MDKTRLQQLGGGVSGGEKARIVAMLVLFVLVLAAFIYLQGMRKPAAELEAPYWEPVTDSEPIPEVTRLPGAQVDPAQLARVADDRLETRVQRDAEAYQYLLRETRKLVPGDMELLGAQPPEYEKLLQDPAAFRGKAMVVKGTLEAIWVYRGNDEPEYRGLLRDRLGHLYFFTVIHPPEVIEGDVIKIEGFFFKLFAYQDDKQETLDNLPYIVGKTAVRSFLPWDPVTSVDPTLLEAVRDDSLRNMDVLEQEPLCHLLSYSLNVDTEAFAAAARQVRHADLMKDPGSLRGSAICLTGSFQLKWPKLLGPNGENPLGIRTVWHALLWQGGRHLTYLISAKPFPDWVQARDYVWVVGLFLKRHAWESKREGVVTGPVVIVQNIVPWEAPQRIIDPAVVLVVAGLVGFVLLGILVSVFVDRRSAREFRRRYLERQRQRLEKGGLASPHPPPGAP
ncbi:MAG: hypothetical protein AB1486_26600, partial [Planctomycetota bacterium]